MNQVFVQGLRLEIREVDLVASELQQHSESPFCVALSHLLKETLELAYAVSTLGHYPSIACHATLTRAVLERLFMAAWVGLSEQNAASYLGAGRREALRQLRKTLTKREARMRDKRTGEDRTATILQRMKAHDLSPPPKVEDLATATGLQPLYTRLYGTLSLLAHGNSANVPYERDLGCDGMVASTSALLRAVAAIAHNRIVGDRATSALELNKIIKFS
jgi:Family of unknown function (DUF5677)